MQHDAASHQGLHFCLSNTVKPVLTPSLPYPSNARGEYRVIYAITPSLARGKHGVVYIRFVSTIIFKGLNSIILICSIMKESLFQDLYHNSVAESLLFTGKMALLMKNCCFFSKMAGDPGISLLCFFEVEVILEV